MFILYGPYRISPYGRILQAKHKIKPSKALDCSIYFDDIKNSLHDNANNTMQYHPAVSEEYANKLEGTYVLHFRGQARGSDFHFLVSSQLSEKQQNC